MMMWQAILGLIFVAAAVVFACWAFYRAGIVQGRELVALEAAERRSDRRREARARAAAMVHRAAPWPGPEPDRRATTGELLALSQAAETGDMAGVKGEVAAFFRLWDLHEWTAKARKRERESAA